MAVTLKDIEAFCREHQFQAYIPTSALTGFGIEELKSMINQTIPWDKQAVISSPELWGKIRSYILKRRTGDEVLLQRSDLLKELRTEYPDREITDSDFDIVIGHAQSQGLVWRLSFGDFILLKPELLNDYASAVVREARAHQKGLGAVPERAILEARINFWDLKRLSDTHLERSLLHSVLELFLAREVALREGEYIVFPSKFSRKLPEEHPRIGMYDFTYRFAGTVEDIYTTLIVRLFYSGAFDMKGIWKNAVEFRDAGRRLCGFILNQPEEGWGEISIFFEEATSIETRALFIRFIQDHLQKRSLINSVKSMRIYRCPECGEEPKDRRAIERALTKKRTRIPCQYCDEGQIVLNDLLQEKFGDKTLWRVVQEIGDHAEEKREKGSWHNNNKSQIRYRRI